MRKKFCCAVGVASLALVASAGTASADTTLGTTSGTLGSPCTVGTSYAIVAGTQSDPSTPDTVPAPGGLITQWQTNTTGDTPGSALSFVVVRPGTSGYTVVGIDTETISTSSGVASFTLANPIAVQAGDIIGLAFNGAPACLFVSEPATDVSGIIGPLSGPPNVGDSESLTTTASNTLPNVAATLAPAREDAGVTTSAGPSGAAAGRPALLSSTVTNNGPGTGPITFTDQVPSGLTVNSAVAGDGTCSTSGQTVTCTVSGLASGASAPVDVVVTPSAAGSYANGASVGVGAPVIDPNSANNSASATLAVGPPAPNPTCVVPKLKNTPVSIAKTVLKDLGCTVKTKHKHSSVHKGDVIGTSPGPGSYAFQSTVTLKVSSGKKKH